MSRFSRFLSAVSGLSRLAFNAHNLRRKNDRKCNFRLQPDEESRVSDIQSDKDPVLF